MLNTGGCVSRTVTVNVQVLLLPALSRAVFVTVVVPTGNANPLNGWLVMFVTAQLSVAVTVNATLLVHIPDAAFAVRLVGHVRTGGSKSWIATDFEQAPMQPGASVTCRASRKLPDEPGFTITEDALVGPTRLAFPETDH